MKQAASAPACSSPVSDARAGTHPLPDPAASIACSLPNSKSCGEVRPDPGRRTMSELWEKYVPHHPTQPSQRCGSPLGSPMTVTRSANPDRIVTGLHGLFTRQRSGT
jgi:hypothetical protein